MKLYYVVDYQFQGEFDEEKNGIKNICIYRVKKKKIKFLKRIIAENIENSEKLIKDWCKETKITNFKLIQL